MQYRQGYHLLSLHSLELIFITPPPIKAPKPIPKYKADALKKKTMEARLVFNEIRYELSAGFIPKQGIPHNKAIRET